MALPNASYDSLFTTTFQKVRGILVDNITTHSVVLAMIKKHGGLRVEEGGHAIRETILYRLNDTVASFSGNEVLATTPQEFATSAVYDWKYVAGTVVVNLTDVFRNSGRSQIANWTRGLVKQLDISVRESVDDMLLADGTGNGGKDIAGINLYAEDGAAWSVVGGIDSNTYTWWRNQYLDFDGTYTTFLTAAGPTYQGIQALQTTYKNCVRKSDKPKLGLTSSAVVNLYEDVLVSLRRTPESDPEMNDLGFDNVLFGKVPIVYTDGIAADDFFWLNPDYLHFVVGKDFNLKMTPFQEATDQVMKVAKMLLFAQMTCSNRARQGRIIDFD